jgi:NADPH-dependent 2,4-dienoyl-CoA reductase/sulfur reductase-like enzyme
MEKTDVLIIGGSASGIVTATTGKSNYPNKEFMVVRKEKKVLVPCGIPYIFGSLESSEKNLVPDAVLDKAGVKLKVDEVVSLDPEKKTCKTDDGTEISFDKLVFATGSTTKIPKWLKGTDKENVFTVPKDKEYLDKMLARLKDCEKIVVVGGGFIGVEVSDELNKRGKDVTIVEILPHVLTLAFDEEIAIKAEETLKSRGVKIKSGAGVKEILGSKKATGVLLGNGEGLDADAIILSMGYSPNTVLAEKAGVKLNEKGFIRVDEYMRTDNPDVFAVGDCAEKKDFFTRKTSGIMLASTACAEARIAGMSLYKLSAVKTFGGTIAIFATALGETGFGVAGLTEDMARKEGFDIVTGTFEGIDKHPGTLPNTNKQMVKLIAARDSGMILGGGVIGGPSTGELTNIIGFAIQNKMTINSLLTAQVGTHPLVTAPPTAYPLIKAAEVVSKKL